MSHISVMRVLLLAGSLVAGFGQICQAQNASVDPSKPLTMDEAVAIGMSNHGSVLSSQFQVVASETRIRQARTGTMPSVQGEVGYNISGDTRRIGTPGDFQSSTSSSAGPQPRVSVGYTIYDGGMTREQVKQARANYAASQAGLGGVRNSLAFIIAADFLSQLRAQKLLDLRKEQERLADEQLSSVRARIEAGSAAQADEALPLAELRNRQVDTVQAANDLSVAASALRNSMGLPVGPPLEVVESGLSETPVPDLDTLIAQATANRPELVQSIERLKIAESSVTQSKIARSPRVDTAVSYVITPSDNSRRDEWLAGASISMPLFDSGLTRARDQEARADLESAKIDHTQALKDVQLEVDQARSNLISARERIVASRTALEAARIGLDQTTERYQLGAEGSSVVSLITAQVQYASAANNAINAEFDVRLAQAELEQALGTRR